MVVRGMPARSDSAETVWSHVRDGAVIIFKGEVYHVHRPDMTVPEVRLTHARKACRRCPHIGRPSGGEPVKVLLPGHPRYVEPPGDVAASAAHHRHGPTGQAKLAEALVTVRLGGSVIARIDETTDSTTCPDVSPNTLATRRGRDALAYHLYLFHDLAGRPAIPDDLSDPGTADDLTALHQITPSAVKHMHKGS